MKVRVDALWCVHWNYRWRGTWFWLKGRQRCRRCRGEGRVPGGIHGGIIGMTTSAASFTARTCPRCEGATTVRGWNRILSEPERVIAEQEAAAEGVFV